jgi:hypothetical protein
MSTDFHQKLGQYIKDKERQNAVDVVLQELAICLANDKENFVEILNNAGVPASIQDSDVVLIEKFTQNALANKKLLIGASLLINYRNKVTNFDGEEEVSDIGVKNAYKVLQYNFIDPEEEHSNLVPLVAVGRAVGKAINKGSDANKKKAEANAKMMAQVLEQRRKEAEEQAKKKAEAKKKTQNIIIIGSTIVIVSIIGIIVYKSNK